MTKQELIAAISPAIMKHNGKSAANVRATLETVSIAELHTLYQRQVAAGYINPHAPSKLELERMAEAAQAVVDAEERILQVQAERAAARVAYELAMSQAREPQRKAESERLMAEDRKAFADAACTLGFGECDANLSLLRQVLGSGNLSTYSIKQVIESGAVSLAPATQSELNERERERIQAHNNFLRQADPETLRRLAKHEKEQNRQRAAQEQVARADAARAERDRYQRYQPIPDKFQGQPLDSEFIKKCSAETLKRLIKMFGASQVTARLRGEN
jgi:hypothetical protein